MYCIWEIGESYTGVWWGKLRDREHLGDSGVNRRIILRRIFRKQDVGYEVDRAVSG